MSTLPPPAPSAPPGLPPYGPAGWPTEPVTADEPARPRSQLAVFVVCALAMGIVCGAAGAPEWGVAGMLALAGGVAIGLAADLRRLFGSVPGAVAALLSMMAMTVALAFIGTGAAPFALIPLVGAFVLGLDWRLVRRLRPLPFAFGFLVIIGAASGETWTYPAGLVWLAAALGALTSLEADRRAAHPQVEAVTAGPVAPDVQTTDLLTTILIALAIALAAALLLSTPSCRRDLGERSGGSGQFGSEGPFGSGGEPGSGSQGTGSGSGSGADHLYVPDPDGRFLVPNAGPGGSEAGSRAIPSPELLPERGAPPRRLTLDDGTQIVAERDPDGRGRITVQDPDGTTRTYTYEERGDGLTEIHELDPGGGPGRVLFYDPEGQMATDDPNAVGEAGSSTSQPEEDDEDDASRLDGRLLVGLVVLLAAAGALAWWLSRRPPKAPPAAAPPWALRLAREIEHEGTRRGRPRPRSQSLARYCRDLEAGPLPDDRLPEVAEVVSTALFARTQPGPDAQHRAEAAWAEIVAAHPPPGRVERRRVRAQQED